MEALIVLAVTFVLLWLFFILPQQRRVRAHSQLVASLREGDEVILTAGIYGRIVDIGAEDMTLEVAPGVELRVARQAVLRRVERDVEPLTPTSDTMPGDAADQGPDSAPDAAPDSAADTVPDSAPDAAPGTVPDRPSEPT
jgi:preprotein translocase subunit YajC